MKIKYVIIALFIAMQSLPIQLPAISTQEKAAYLKNPYTDHVQHFEKLFELVKIDSFLEFGIGLGTKYFLDNCSEVTSCEIILPDQSQYWFDYTVDQFQNYKNWIPILIGENESLHYPNILCYRDKKYPALYDATYLLRLKEICDQIFKSKCFDVAFVDPGFHMRGDLVNELFDRVPIIVAHDTNHAPEIYGWKRIQTPSNYEKIVFTEGMGTTFWIRKDRQELISKLQNRIAISPLEGRKFRIFFPQMHPVLVQSMALVCQYLGHTLVLPGESFSPSAPNNGLKISYGTFFKKNPIDSESYTSFFSKVASECSFLNKNIEVIENDEILNNPPDILTVNCLEVEKNIYDIWNALPKKTSKIIHYSGNNGSHYNSKWVKNLISTDAYTEQFYNPNTTNIIFWIPWIDFESMPFEGTNDSQFINSYIGHYYESSFPSSSSIFRLLKEKMKNEIPSLSIESYPKPGLFPYIRHNEIFSFINQSCATLHIKETEGFGYTILESIAKGRPVFLKRSFSLGSRLMNWCIEGKTAFFFDDYKEFKSKMLKYISEKEYRHQVQKDCAITIRKIIDNEKQARILENFLQNLLPISVY